MDALILGIFLHANKTPGFLDKDFLKSYNNLDCTDFL